MVSADPICPTCETPFFNNAVICPACRNRLEQWFAETDSLLADLDVTLSKQSVTDGGMGSGEVDATPTPFHVGASNAADHYRLILIAWAGLVQDQIGWWDQVIGPDGRVVRFPDGTPHVRWVSDAPYHGDGTSQSIASYLLHHVDWLARHEAAPDCYQEVGGAVNQIMHVMDTQPGRRIIGPCGALFEGVECTETVWAFEGHTVARCRTCGANWDVRERRLASYMEAVTRTAGPIQLTRAFQRDGIALTTHRITVWANRGLLTPVRPRQYVVAHVARLLQMSESNEKLSNWESRNHQ